MFLEGFSIWIVQNELKLPKIIREFRCDDLDTPHAYVSIKTAFDQKWPPSERDWGPKSAFWALMVGKGSNMCNQAHLPY